MINREYYIPCLKYLTDTYHILTEANDQEHPFVRGIGWNKIKVIIKPIYKKLFFSKWKIDPKKGGQKDLHCGFTRVMSQVWLSWHWQCHILSLCLTNLNFYLMWWHCWGQNTNACVAFPADKIFEIYHWKYQEIRTVSWGAYVKNKIRTLATLLLSVLKILPCQYHLKPYMAEILALLCLLLKYKDQR